MAVAAVVELTLLQTGAMVEAAVVLGLTAPVELALTAKDTLAAQQANLECMVLAAAAALVVLVAMVLPLLRATEALV